MPFFFSIPLHPPQSFVQQYLLPSLMVLGWSWGMTALPIGATYAVASPHSEVARSSNVDPPQVTFVPPTDREPQTEGAGSRGDYCHHTNAIAHQSVMALLPDESDYGLTVKSHPVFLLQLTNIQADVLTFTINDEEGENLYQANVPVEQSTGIIRVQLPEQAPSLEVDHLYKWGIIIPCSGQIRPDSPFVQGWIRRTQGPVFTLESDDYPSVEAANQYGQAGIWYDMIAMLEELTQQNPHNSALNRIWSNFLPSSPLSHSAP